MSMRNLGIVATSLMLAACPGTPGDDTVDASGDDAPAGENLNIRIKTDHSIPASIDDGDLTIDEIRVTTTSIRAIGDAAPGDSRTTKTDVELHWNEEDAPELLTFTDAPSGRYSTIKLQIARFEGSSGGVALEIRGDARINGDYEPFIVRSVSAVIPAMATVDTALMAGQSATIEVELDTDDIGLDSIGWDTVPLVGGVHLVDDSRPELSTVTTKLATAFK